VPDAERTRLRLEAVDDRDAFVPILLEAEASETVLRNYLDAGELYRVVIEGRTVGALLLIPQGDAIEIKAIALLEAFRRRGLGRTTIDETKELARRAGASRLTVGTADTSVDAVAFYRRVGFREAGRIDGFFDAYPEPVIEDGAVAHDMLRFEMAL
jgi:ribosomal protein S18 acetylase RimI-like enzyme